MTDTPNTQTATKSETNPTRSEYFTKFVGELLGDLSPHSDIVDAWVIQATLEDNHAAWNPSSLTQPEDGATEYNAFGPGNRYHVWNYVSAEQALSAWLKLLGNSEYAPLRNVMTRIQAANGTPISAGESNTAVLLAAIATSPFTGITGQPNLYEGIVADNAIVTGPGGWPDGWTKFAPAPAPADINHDGQPGFTSEAAAVESAVDAEIATVRSDTDGSGKVLDAAAVAKALDGLDTHLAELRTLLA